MNRNGTLSVKEYELLKFFIERHKQCSYVRSSEIQRWGMDRHERDEKVYSINDATRIARELKEAMCLNIFKTKRDKVAKGFPPSREAYWELTDMGRTYVKNNGQLKLF